MNIDDLPEGYRWATQDECETYSMDPDGHPEMTVVLRTVDTNGVPYIEGESDIAIKIGLMPYDKAISYAIFAINTIMHPDASEPIDVDDLEQMSEDVIATLADIRETLHEMAKVS